LEGSIPSPRRYRIFAANTLVSNRHEDRSVGRCSSAQVTVRPGTAPRVRLAPASGQRRRRALERSSCADCRNFCGAARLSVCSGRSRGRHHEVSGAKTSWCRFRSSISRARAERTRGWSTFDLSGAVRRTGRTRARDLRSLAAPIRYGTALCGSRSQSHTCGPPGCVLGTGRPGGAMPLGDPLPACVRRERCPRDRQGCRRPRRAWLAAPA
jgi:hypothetical protein